MNNTSIKMLFRFTCVLLVITFHCEMREGNILSMREYKPTISESLTIDTKWKSFNFSDSTGTLSCSLALDLDSFSLYVGTHPDSLNTRYTSAKPSFLINAKINMIVYYKLTVYRSTGEDLSDTGSIQMPSGTPPSQPFNIIVEGGTSGVSLKWQQYGFVDHFSIYRTDNIEKELAKIGETSAMYFFDSTESYKIKWYTVSAINQFGETRSTMIVPASRIIDLAAPDSFAASKGKLYHRIKLSWKQNKKAASYTIFRADSVHGPYLPIAIEIKDTTFVDSVDNYEYYYYKVASVDQNGRSGATSSLDSGFSKLLLDPPVISDISKGSYENKIFIYWNKVEQAIGYNIYRSTDKRLFALLATTSDTSYVDFVQFSQNYHYQIASISPDSIVGLPSNIETGYVREIEAPQNLSISRESKFCIQLEWDTVASAVSYTIYRTNDLQKEYELIAESETNQYCDEVFPGTIWFYHVRAVLVSKVESKPSNVVHGEGPGLRDPNEVFASQGTSQYHVELVWNSVKGATGYHIYRSTPSSSYSLLTSKVNDTIFFDSTALDMNYYRICAVDSTGAEGVYSSVVTGYPAQLDTIKDLYGSVDIPHAIQLNWSSVPVAEKYIVFLSPTAVAGPYLPFDTVDSPVYVDTTRISAYYKIAVLYKNRTSKLSNHVFGRKLQPPLDLLYTTEQNCVRLTWTPSTGASSYNIYKSVDNIIYQFYTKVNEPFYNDSSVSEGTYYYKVTSVSKNGETPQSASVTVLYKKGVSDFKITPIPGSLLLEWSPLENVTEYYVYGLSEGDSIFTLVNRTTDTIIYLSFNISGRYLFKVRGWQNGSFTSFSEVKSGIVFAKPLAPTLRSITNRYDSIQIQWQSNPLGEAADAFVIYRSTNSSTGYNPIDTTTDTIYSDTPPLRAYTYYYKVAGINSSGTGELSSNYLYGSLLLLQPPQKLTISNFTFGTHVALSWSPAESAKEYAIARSSASGNSIIAVVADTFYNDSTASTGTGFYYFVSSINGADTSSAVAGLGGILSAPESINLISTYDRINLSWSAVSGASKYYIYRATNTSGPYSKIDSTTTTGYSDYVKNPIYYYYKISSTNLSESPLSTVYRSGRLLLPQAPSSISASSGDYENAILVSWYKIEGSIEYEVYRSNTGSINDIIHVATTTDTAVFDTVVSDSFYYYFVKGIGIGGDGVLNSSGVRGFRIPQSEPDPPLNLTVSNNRSEYIALSWSAPNFSTPPLKGFLIYRAESESGSFTVIDTVSSASYYDFVRKSYPTIYYYFVKSYNLRGESTPTDTLAGSRTP